MKVPALARHLLAGLIGALAFFSPLVSVALTESVDPNVAATVEITSSGFNLLSSPFSLAVQQDPSAQIEKRSFLEFSLSTLTPGTTILAAALELEVTTAGSGAIPVHGYGGNGTAELDDVIIPTDDRIGLSEPILQTGTTIVSLDTEFIEGLLGSSTHLGVLLLGSDNTLETRFGALGVQPAALNLTLTDPGDFDFDGDVDGQDFLLWQLGLSPNSGSASDLLDWETNYGMTATVAAILAVPEPSTVGLVLLATVGTFSRRSRVGRRPAAKCP